jgi:nucleoside-diphosphate-sugar epimerase
MKKILVTGGSGFIGKTLISELKKKYIIYAIVRNKKTNREKKNVKYIHIKKIKSLRKKNIFAVIHLATFYTKKYDEKSIKKILDANIIFGLNIINNINKKYCKKFVYFSTMMEHMNGKKYNPLNFYASSKMAFSNIINFYENIYKNTKFYNIKVSETFGLNDNRRKILPALINSLKKNELFLLNNKKLSLNFVHVLDVVKAIAIILNKNIKPAIYSIENRKDNNIYELIKFLNLKKFKVKNNKIENYGYKFKRIPGWKPEYDLCDFLKKII